MEKQIVQHFYDFFQDFLSLCICENWPENSTTDDEIKNAFQMAIHFEKCFDNLQRRSLFNDFLNALNNESDYSTLFIRNCFTNPAKVLLRKIIKSNCDINQIDLGIQVFIQLYSEEKFEDCLADIMVETASVQTLLNNVNSVLSIDNIRNFKSTLFLYQLKVNNNVTETCLNLCKNSEENDIELLVKCLINRDIKYHYVKNEIKNVFLTVMSNRTTAYRNFWRCLLHIEKKLLIDVCLEFNDIFQKITKSLIDSSKLIKENMSTEYFYIDLSYSELKLIIQAICENHVMKDEFMNNFIDNEFDLLFWENILNTK